jgi:hypothetical protein
MKTAAYDENREPLFCGWMLVWLLVLSQSARWML